MQDQNISAGWSGRAGRMDQLLGEPQHDQIIYQEGERQVDKQNWGVGGAGAQSPPKLDKEAQTV